ncbi:hypothetical protein BN903_24 [Halorubrum sp. AJ67]|nr:hypothetical protein BN903_24 [Halorubrum sp. AJ67]
MEKYIPDSRSRDLPTDIVSPRYYRVSTDRSPANRSMKSHDVAQIVRRG